MFYPWTLLCSCSIFIKTSQFDTCIQKSPNQLHHSDPLSKASWSGGWAKGHVIQRKTAIAETYLRHQQDVNPSQHLPLLKTNQPSTMRVSGCAATCATSTSQGCRDWMVFHSWQGLWWEIFPQLDVNKEWGTPVSGQEARAKPRPGWKPVPWPVAPHLARSLGMSHVEPRGFYGHSIYHCIQGK